MSNPGPGRRSFRKCWIFLGIFVLFLVFFWCERKWSTQTLQQYQAELAAAGVNLNWPSLVPPMPPDDDNFFFAPIVQRWIPKKGEARSSSSLPLKDQPPSFPDLAVPLPPSMYHLATMPEPERDELGAWFDQWDDSFAELLTAGKRPHAQLPGDYSSPEKVPIPDYVSMRSLAQILATRARIHLLQGRGDLALRDLDAVAVMMRALESRPVPLVSSMIRCALGGLYLEVVDDGFARSLWKPGDLPELQRRLAPLDFLANYLQSINEGERAATCYLLEQLITSQDRQLRGNIAQMIFGANPFMNRLVVFMPASWIRRNQILGSQLLQQSVEVFDVKARRFYPEKQREAQQALNDAFSKKRPQNILIGAFVPNFTKAAGTIVKNQTRVIHLTILCALERYRHQHGEHPLDLTQLIPEFLSEIPHDLVTGQPPLYQKSAPLRSMLTSEKEL